MGLERLKKMPITHLKKIQYISNFPEFSRHDMNVQAAMQKFISKNHLDKKVEEVQVITSKATSI